MALLDQKEEAEAKRALGHCTACGQLTQALRTIGAPNEILEAQNATNQRLLEATLALNEQYKQTPKK